MRKLRARAAIRTIARQQGISTAQCRAENQEAITEAWRNADPQASEYQRQLVGDSHIPSPEEFILLISQKVLDFR